MKNKMGMSFKDRLTIVAMWTVGMIILILIFLDPLNILDSAQEIILAVIVIVANTPLLLYQRQRILKKLKKAT
jgi:FtsH-binding integral membrane protein